MLKAVFLFLAAIGLAMAAFGVYFILYSNEATSWPSVEGEIVRTTVRSQTPSAGNSGRTQSSRDRLRTYYPQITYRWTVDGRSYDGSRYSLGAIHKDYPERSEAEQAAAAFPAGGAIEVFYDPADPSSAVLDRSLQGGAYVPLPLGLLMLWAGLMGLKNLPRIQAASPSDAIDLD